MSESWLTIDIERPTGAGGVEDLGADEPRRVAITGTGPRGAELEASLAARG